MTAKRIESSPEIVAMLQSYLVQVEAEAAILYKYIDIEDIEGTEILDLLSKSNMVRSNHDFFTDVIDNTTELKSQDKKLTLKMLVDHYKKGTLEVDDSRIVDILYQLKQYIRVLRFCDLAEKDPENSMWTFDYTRRPPKYLVLSKKILNQQYKQQQIPYEGITSYFCRMQGNRKHITVKKNENFASNVPKNKYKDFLKSESDKLPFLILTREDIRENNAYSRFTQDTNTYNNYNSLHACWMLLAENLNEEKNNLGCLRFEYYSQKLEDEEYLKEVFHRFQKLSIKPVISMSRYPP